MTKPVKTSVATPSAKTSPKESMTLRDPKTGKAVTVKGFGALKNGGLKLKRGVNLLKPIAKQALGSRAERRKSG